ncbi:MAG: SprT-like domain-containing protein, partial [Bacteroidales bacterium]|nr:SprT-like domain-containing protein [Bacteroidales bacterium]
MRIDPQILAQHIPEAAVNPLSEWLLKNKVQLRISKARATKLGDFRAPKDGDIPRISVNHNLNRYAFLITLVHEMAHVESWRNRSFFRREKPHGKKWKSTFAKLMEPFLNESIFPKELLPVV